MVSVIVPIYNVEKYLCQCVDSIISQTYQDLEIILVDDGSIDGCGHICDEYKEKDSRIRVIHKTNGGLSDARNAGIEAATGEYYVFVDSDDVIHPQMIEILMTNLCSKDADMAVCGFWDIEEDTQPSFERVENEGQVKVYEKESIMDQLEDQNLITVVAWNKLYKASLFQEIRYPEGHIHEDEFIIHRLLFLCRKTVYVDLKLYYYRKRNNSIMSHIDQKSIRDEFLAYEDRIAFLTEQGHIKAGTDAKLQLMYVIIKYRKILKNNSKSDELTIYMRQRFAELYAEADVQKELNEERKRKYAVFCKSPRKYYFTESMEEKREWIKDTIKRWCCSLKC